MKRNHVWVVESFVNGKWQPMPNSNRSTRILGRIAMNVARIYQPRVKHRLRKYVTESGEG